MLLFSIEDGFVRPYDTTLLISPFREIWERDDTVHKERASSDFAYIYFFCSFSQENPYIGYIDDEVRSKKIIEGLFPDEEEYWKLWKLDELIIKAIERYKEFQHNASPTLAYFESVRKALDTLREFWDNLDMTKTTKTGQLVNKPSDVVRGIEQTSVLLVRVKDLELKVRQEILTANRTRGNRTIGYFEKLPK